MLRWMRDTGGDPLFAMVLLASRLRRKGRLRHLAAALALVVAAWAIWLLGLGLDVLLRWG